MGQKKWNKNCPQEKKKTELGNRNWAEKNGPEETKLLTRKLTPGGQFHPIHEIPERDFLDGELVGAGSLKPYEGT